MTPSGDKRKPLTSFLPFATMLEAIEELRIVSV
jgi:hypothetical protein